MSCDSNLDNLSEEAYCIILSCFRLLLERDKKGKSIRPIIPKGEGKLLCKSSLVHYCSRLTHLPLNPLQNFSQQSSICANCVDYVGQKNKNYWTFFFFHCPLETQHTLVWLHQTRPHLQGNGHATFHIVYSHCALLCYFFILFACCCTESSFKLDQLFFFVLFLNEAKLPCCSVCMGWDWWFRRTVILLLPYFWQVTGLYSCWLLFLLVLQWLVKNIVSQKNRRSHHTAISQIVEGHFVVVVFFCKCCQVILQ